MISGHGYGTSEARQRGKRPENMGRWVNPAYNGFNHVDVSPHLRQILILTSFLIPGLGLAADHCMTKILSAISSLGNAVKFISKHCERIQCPNCYEWWISQRAFKLAVLIECYSKFTNERPAGVVCSVHPDVVRSWEWKNYGNFMRTCYQRLYKLDVLGGVRFFHPFRIKDSIKTDLRKLGAKDSGGFWKMIRSNVLNLPSWYSYVCLSPHIHSIVFPSFISENTNKDIVIKKYAVFGSFIDTVAHVRYLLSHCGLLTSSENEPASPFGCLHGWKPENHLTYDEILSIKNRVAEAMGLCYNQLKNDIEVKSTENEEEDNYEWIPIHQFADYSAKQIEFSRTFLDAIPNRNYASFVGDIINIYNDRRSDHECDRHKRHVFIEDLVDIPSGFKVIMSDRDTNE